jgi:hypothetical protein
MADVIKIGPLGPYANNAYVIVDTGTKRRSSSTPRSRASAPSRRRAAPTCR